MDNINLQNDFDFDVNKFGLGIRPFDYTLYGDNCGYEWKKWMRSFQCFMLATGVKDSGRKFALLLHFAGSKVQEVFATLPEREKGDTVLQGPLSSGYVFKCTGYEQAVEKLDEFFLPKKNVTYERFMLRQIFQKVGETVGNFSMRLRVQAEQCDFGDGLEMSVKEVLISNCDETLRKDLMKLTVMRDVDLESLVKAAKGIEAVNKQCKTLKGSSKPQTQISLDDVNRIGTDERLSNFKQRVNTNIECYRCGKFGHFSSNENCPAKNKFCNRCGGRGHFMNKCRSIKRENSGFDNHKSNPFRTSIKRENGGWDNYKSNSSSTSTFKRVRTDEPVRHVIEEKDDNYVFGITDEDTYASEGYDPGNEIQCKIGGIDTSAIIDSGSKRNLMDEATWKWFKSHKISVISQQKQTDQRFRSYGGRLLTNLGVFDAMVKIFGIEIRATFYVIKEKGPLLIGRITGHALGILRIGSDVNMIDEIPSSEALGKIKGIVIDIPINENVKPVIQPYRRIPVALENIVDQKVEELLKQDIIEAVHGPSRWISPVVLSQQKNGYRFCIDMRRANQAVERENHPLPTIDEFLTRLAGAKWFSKLDVRQAFHQLEISLKSREITTFMTRKGLFRYKRLMFGITCAPELFQKIMEQILSNCGGCFNFIDDIIIYGTTKEEHDERVKKVLEKLTEYLVTLRKEKCIIGVKEVQFLGHTISENGVTPTLSKISSVKQFRVPKTAEEVRSFLGLVNYIGKFIPNLATISDPLRLLTKQGSKFVWEERQNKSFEQLKDLMTRDLALGFYNVNDRTQLYADASPVGLGAVLVQINSDGPRVISYAHKTLSAIEKRYAQTEKEALALVWSTERFHFYLYGRDFELVTDHKPLEVIFGPKSRPCARIERWVLRLQSYKYRVIYRPGKNNIADPLSRLVVDTSVVESFDEDVEDYVNWVASTSTPVAMKLSEIQEQSLLDSEIQAVKAGVYEDKWDDEIKIFKIFEMELCFAGEILLRGTRIVLPKILRLRALELAHEGHPGMSVMKRRLRSKLWWPKIDENVENFVKKCRGCQLVSAPSAPEPMKRKDLPSESWQHLAIDFMGPLPTGHTLFVIVDYFSRYIEVEIMTKTDTSLAINRLEVIFARFGLPISITADNGGQFTSGEMELYCKTNNIDFNNTIPYWPQQNGEVERQNKSILKRLQIAHAVGKDWRDELLKFLIMYRSTPHTTTMKTPAELMFGRNIRDKLPNIHQPMERDEEVADRDKQKKEEGKQYADGRRNAKESEIQEGDGVLVKRLKKTNKLDTIFDPTVHRVVEKKGPETVVEDLSTNKLYRRNVAHLKKLDDCVAKPVLNDVVSDPSTGVSKSSHNNEELQSGPRRSERLKRK